MSSLTNGRLVKCSSSYVERVSLCGLQDRSYYMVLFPILLPFFFFGDCISLPMVKWSDCSLNNSIKTEANVKLNVCTKLFQYFPTWAAYLSGCLPIHRSALALMAWPARPTKQNGEWTVCSIMTCEEAGTLFCSFVNSINTFKLKQNPLWCNGSEQGTAWDRIDVKAQVVR